MVKYKKKKSFSRLPNGVKDLVGEDNFKKLDEGKTVELSSAPSESALVYLDEVKTTSKKEKK